MEFTITGNFGVFVKLKNNIPGRFFVRNEFILSPSCISLTRFFLIPLTVYVVE